VDQIQMPQHEGIAVADSRQIGADGGGSGHGVTGERRTRPPLSERLLRIRVIRGGAPPLRPLLVSGGRSVLWAAQSWIGVLSLRRTQWLTLQS
jgi:hypothetical protein